MSTSTDHPAPSGAELLTRLCAPFDGNQVRVRSQAGRQLSYITARTAMNRLDEVFGLDWSDEYFETEKGLRCRITVKLPDGTKVSREDGGAAAGMSEADNDEKSGYSDAFKRAAVKFGIARYLYQDSVPDFAQGEHGEVTQSRPQAQQQRRGEPPREQHGDREQQRPASPVPGNAPRSGRALFAWVKEQEQRYEVGLLKYINGWAKLQDYPGRMVDWDGDQVNRAYSECCRKLQALSQSHAEEYEEALEN